MKKRIAFVYGRAGLNSAKIQYMPFGFNVLKKLAEDSNNTIDFYLTQTYTDDYKKQLPNNVTPVFLDKPSIWSHGSGLKLFILLNWYFKRLTLFKKYDLVYGIGQVGVVLGGKLAKRNKAKFICLNDEFPDISYLKIWRENEKKYTATASTVIVPDESRVDVLKKQIPELKNINVVVLPNIPFVKDVEIIQGLNWHAKLELDSSVKLVMYAGGIDRENNIELLLTAFPFTKEDFVLVMVGNGKNYKDNRYFNHPRIIWIEKVLTDAELHSLIKQCVCNVCYYSDILDLEYVGKSSGKIMRSLLMGTPVITTRFKSLQFIEDEKIGVLITQPYELVDAINTIDASLAWYKGNIENTIEKYKFETYWNQIQELN